MLRDELATLIRGTANARTPVREALHPGTPAWICVLAGALLSLIGLYAIDVATALDPAESANLSRLAMRQLIFLGVGVLAAFTVALPHYRLLGQVSTPAFLILLGLLVFLLVPFVPTALVTPRNGARAWINLGVADFQPSELCKIAFVLVIARYLRFRREHRDFIGLIPLGIITAIPVGLITLQPDLGTAMLFVPSLFAMLLAAGARVRHLGIIVLCAALAAPAVYPVLRPHQRARLDAMWQQIRGDESLNHDINFQPSTAQRLVGAGGLEGNDDERARALVYFNGLPEAQNDMVFAVLVNRFGLAGGILVLALYAAWMLGAVLTAASCREPFGRLIVVGLAAFIGAQTIVNIGMNIGLMPIIGVTLPFVSYGGSSMLASWLMTGLVFSVGLHWPPPPYRPSFEYG